jgi:hypothetical protein
MSILARMETPPESACDRIDCCSGGVVDVIVIVVVVIRRRREGRGEDNLDAAVWAVRDAADAGAVPVARGVHTGGAGGGEGPWVVRARTRAGQWDGDGAGAGTAWYSRSGLRFGSIA